MRYIKPPLTIAQQIQLLQQRGLIIDDTAKVTEVLSFISYYRLRAYTYPYQINSDPNHPFHPGITFERILNTYLFDRSLRIIVFDAIERIEIALRTQIIYHYALIHGSHWFEDPSLFRNSFYLTKDLKELDKEIDRSNEQFINHYHNKYSQPSRPPSWMSLEVSSFGLLSKFFENLKLSPEKKQIARTFKLGHPFVLESWMHAIAVVRNICAHHSRLWNREIPTSPAIPSNTLDTFLQDVNVTPTKSYFMISIIAFLLNATKQDHQFIKKIRELITKYPEINVSQMGFPAGWELELLWKV